MASGARLRSDNEAFGRAGSGTAFLISAAPPPDPELFTCIYSDTAGGGTSNLVFDYPPMPVSDVNCGCSTTPSPNADDRVAFGSIRYIGGNASRGLGWEDPPHPAVQLNYQTSGYQVQVPVHCATKCPGWPFREFNNYSIISGASGPLSDYIVDQGSTNEGDLPPSNGLIWVSQRVNTPGLPWIVDEPVEIVITFTRTTLPDPGPYNIVGARAHSSEPNWTTLTFDRAVRYATAAALNIEGTGLYDGMQAARPSGDHFQDAPEDMAIETPFLGNVTTGTATRVYEGTWDCWNNAVSPSGPRPPLPSAPT